MVKTVWKFLGRVASSKFDLWEVALLAVLVFFVVRAQRPETVLTDLEIEPFRTQYGPHHNTEHHEEWFIRDFFSDRRGGYFLDVGANHHQQFNKTYYLERQLGWSGIAIEPLRQFEEGYRQHRPNTKFFPLFVSDKSDQTAKLYVLKDNTLVSSSDENFTRAFGTPDEVRTVPTVALNDLLARERVTKIDFVSMDIELHEPQALAGFDLQRFKPSLVCIEGLLPVRQTILDHFARTGYVLVGKYMRVDRENMYFMPLAGMSPGTAAADVKAERANEIPSQ
jgi:FkbM family methyltransferase